MSQNKLPNLQARLSAACVNIADSKYLEPFQDQLERLVMRAELYSDAATGKRIRSAYVPDYHPDKATFDRINRDHP